MESHRFMTNPVVRWQVLSADPDASTAFFSQLFGWRVSRDNPLGYREVRAGEGGIHGGVWPAPPGVPPFVQLFVRVGSIDETIHKATALGAKLIVPKSVLPGGDEMAVLLDPQGLPIAICTA
jgi:predicted enzyme related to lactoylglutathione lyase